MNKWDRQALNHKAFDLAIQDMQNINEKHSDIYEQIEQATDEEVTNYIAEMLEDGFTFDYENLALLRAEYIGVCNYKVKGNKMIYLSYFGSEGFVKVTHNLDTGKETRKHQNTTKLEYNYFCG